MKLLVGHAGKTYSLTVSRQGELAHYALDGAPGQLSLARVAPGVYSALDGVHSFTVRVAQVPSGLEVWADSQRFLIALEDPRDRSRSPSTGLAAGPVELRASMPGKIVKILVQPGEAVAAGQGLIVVEAMKMQNEVKAPRDAQVKAILCSEGAAAGANEPLIVLE